MLEVQCSMFDVRSILKSCAWTQKQAARMAGAAAVLLATMAMGAGEGVITATVECDAPVSAVWAIERRRTPVGVYHHPYAGTVTGRTIRVAGLPVPGRYALKLQVGDGIVEGWDADVPESDYVEEQPLVESSIRKITKKMTSDQFTAFADEAEILDLQGNIQNAALLLFQLRRRPFVGGGYKPGEWVWRVDRWQWEDPDEKTWVPYQERPYYALVRERLYEKDYREKKVLFARHLGGITLSRESAVSNVGLLRIPVPIPGVHAVDPDGKIIKPVRLKPAGVAGKGNMP
ncbi:MAG: hypothetical protein HQ559_05270 [Lentisphaerae bacterium]|nr:hypothetical protein [Lentisphaerota bacterium]